MGGGGKGLLIRENEKIRRVKDGGKGPFAALPKNERKEGYTRFSVLKNSLRRKTRLILAGETYPGTILSHNDSIKTNWTPDP